MKSLIKISTLLILGSSLLLSKEGCIQGDCENGYGTYIFPSGQKYVGEWKNYLRNGHGTNTWSDGEKYVGEFKDGLNHGHGTYTWSDGRKHVGEYVHGLKNGYGIGYSPDGEILFQGQWNYDSPVE